MSSLGTQGKDFMLIVSGPVGQVPFLAGWQEFKDSLRKVVQHQPGWTDVKEGPAKGEKQGWCRFERREDARTAHDQYSAAGGVLVHIFETSRINGHYEMVNCNCSSYFPDMSANGHSPRRSGILAGSLTMDAAATRGVSASSYISGGHSMHSSRGYSSPAQYSQAPAYSHPSGYSQALGYSQPSGYSHQYTYAQPSAYHQASTYSYYQTPAAYTMQGYSPSLQVPIYPSANGIPVNVSGGAMLTEARGIFISSLNFKTRYLELDGLLAKAAQTPIDRRLHMDARTGAFKGHATATYASQTEAEQVVHQLHNIEHDGMTINVRLDVDAKIVGRAKTPAIANGSISRG